MKIAIINPYRLWDLSQVKIGSEISSGDIPIDVQTPRMEKLISDSPELLAELRELLLKAASHTSDYVLEVEDARHERSSDERTQGREDSAEYWETAA